MTYVILRNKYTKCGFRIILFLMRDLQKIKNVPRLILDVKVSYENYHRYRIARHSMDNLTTYQKALLSTDRL